MARTVSKSKFQEWAGLDRVNLAVHEMHCIFREITKDDFGVDGEIDVVVPKEDGTGYETTGGILKVQVKSGVSYVKQDTPTSFSCPVDKTDLLTWLRMSYPFILIVYHPADDKLYWKDVKAYAKGAADMLHPPIQIGFDKRVDEFSKSAYSRIRDISSVSPPRVDYNERERLYSNLLTVTRLPRLITGAIALQRDYAIIRAVAGVAPPPFCIIGDRLFTFADLRSPHCVLRQFCDVGTIADVQAERWMNDPERQRDYVFLLNQLLGIHLRRCGVRYSRDARRNYFPRENETDEEFKKSWFNVRTNKKSARQRLVVKYYRYGALKFWRHLASHLSFRRAGARWFLQIEPMYFFTEDGSTPWDPDLVGPYTTQLKARERNNHVLNQVLFWSDVLARGREKIEFEYDHRPLVVIEREPVAGIASFAIPDDPATFEEEEATQLSLFGELQGQDENDVF